jgi:hypothetical protein
MESEWITFYVLDWSLEPLSGTYKPKNNTVGNNNANSNYSIIEGL